MFLSINMVKDLGFIFIKQLKVHSTKTYNFLKGVLSLCLVLREAQIEICYEIQLLLNFIYFDTIKYKK